MIFLLRNDLEESTVAVAIVTSAVDHYGDRVTCMTEHYDEPLEIAYNNEKGCFVFPYLPYVDVPGCSELTGHYFDMGTTYSYSLSSLEELAKEFDLTVI